MIISKINTFKLEASKPKIARVIETKVATWLAELSKLRNISKAKIFQDWLYQKEGCPKDDDGHYVVSADVGGAGEEDKHDEHHAARHHRHRVEAARQEVDQPGHMSFFGTTHKPR